MLGYSLLLLYIFAVATFRKSFMGAGLLQVAPLPRAARQSEAAAFPFARKKWSAFVWNGVQTHHYSSLLW